jgi:hypothetical protein
MLPKRKYLVKKKDKRYSKKLKEVNLSTPRRPRRLHHFSTEF